ncbi:uncharacterized protein LOC119092534 [Pollicipes pollicipes]|uniref:uncharacterized protein LOC119092534 n=1 Tax=Pollicipes pollicipes TaxID=41117 RepID=UPI001884C7EC|nr:uncharacterized protein LOC119092534 [Pollicipes pollicipes]
MAADGTARWTVQGNIASNPDHFLVDTGDGSPRFRLNGTQAVDGSVDFSSQLTFLAPGDYTVAVLTVGGAAAASNSTSVTVQSASLLTSLTCPPLVVPDQQYHCLASASGSAVQLSATFSDEGTAVTLVAPTAPWTRVGRAPPQGDTGPEVKLAGGEQQVTLRQPFVDRTLLRALRWYGATDGTCELTLMAGSCSGTGELFCASSGRCTTYCPLLPDSRNLTCDASQPTLCALSGQCSTDGTGSGTCTATSAPMWTASSLPGVPFSTAAGAYGHLVLTTEMWAEVGHFAQVTCTTGSLAHLSTSAGAGDFGSSEDKQYLVEVVGIPEAPIGIPHTCGGMGNITLAIPSDSSAASTLSAVTSCEVPIENITMAVAQKGAPVVAESSPPTTVAFCGEFVVEALEPVTIQVQIAQGAPVLLDYDFGTANIPSVSEAVDRPVLAAETFEQTVSYAASGVYTVRVTGRNQHSDPVRADLLRTHADRAASGQTRLAAYQHN